MSQSIFACSVYVPP